MNKSDTPDQTARSYIKSWDNFINIVAEDKSVNLIALAVTQWTASSIDALIFFLTDMGIAVNASIVIAEHRTNGYLIDSSSFTNNQSQYFYLPYKESSPHANQSPQGKWQKLRDTLNYYRIIFSWPLQKNSTLYYATFNHETPDAIIINKYHHIGRPMVICGIEEGVGIYMGTLNHIYPKLRDINSISEFHGYFRAVFMGRTLYRILHPHHNSLTLKSTCKGLTVNKAIVPYYRKVFSMHKLSLPTSLDASIISQSIIICTVAWKRECIYDNEDYRVMKKVCDYLYNRGQKLLLKPHPRDQFFPERASDMHCQLFSPKGVSLEVLCEFAQPRAIISFSSTTLINPQVFWGIPTYCISEMLDRDKIGDVYLNEFSRFKSTFKNFVHFIHNEHEIDIV